MKSPGLDMCASDDSGWEQAREKTSQGINPSNARALPWYKLKKKYGVRHRDALAYKMSFFLGVVVLAVLGVNLGVIKRNERVEHTESLHDVTDSFLRGPMQKNEIGVSKATSTSMNGDYSRRLASNDTQCKTGLATLNVTLSPDYPEDLFSDEQRASGAIVLHIIFVMFCFVGLAIVCDDYFESSLEAICEALGLKEDVAGATFMAAGGSAPELFTSIMGVFVSKSDVGFGTIIGSAVFNVLFVIAVCAYMCPNLSLTWWPLARDSVFYLFSIMVLTCCVQDQTIYWHEAFILLCCYALYVTVMYFNEKLQKLVTNAVQREKKRNNGCIRFFKAFTSHFLFEGVVYAVIFTNVVAVFFESPEADASTLNTIFIINISCSVFFIVELIMRLIADGLFSYWRDPMNVFDGILVALIILEWVLSLMSTGNLASGASSGVARGLRVLRFFRAWRVLRFIALISKSGVTLETKSTQTEDGDSANSKGYIERAPSKRVLIEEDQTKVHPVSATSDESTEGKSGESDAGDDEDDDEGPPNPFEVPDSACGKFWWIFGFPLHLLMWLTIPHPEGKCGNKVWPVTFIMCIAWITGLSYAMVWMAVIIGYTWSIPDAIMGLTLLAGGTSIPDALSSLAVAKRGFGDMAVSSSIGSNVFDILMGLPIPWIIACWVGLNGGSVRIYSENLLIMILTLFIMVSVVIMTIHWAGWKLTVPLANVMMFLYFVFVAESLLLELNLIFPKCI